MRRTIFPLFSMRLRWHRRGVISLSLGLGFLGLAGCRQTMGPVAETPSLPIPAEWSVAELASGPVDSDWIAAFGDSRLEEWVRRALDESPSLAAAAARLAAAAQTARINGADVFPDLTASLDASRRRGGDPSYTAGVAISWEIDFLGKVRDGRAAAFADYGAAENGFHAARLSLAANVARAWFDLLEAEGQRALAAETLAAFESNLEIIEQQYESGLSSALDVRLLRANAASARASLAGRERARDAAARVLEVLLGGYPANALVVASDLPMLAEPPPAGLPSELLWRRPDLRQAEFALEAASLRASVARKALFPSLRLTSASLGRSSDELDGLLDGETVWAVAGGLTAPLFRGGELRAASKRARALAEAAVEDYRQTALTAFLEVESTLAAEAFWLAQEQALATAVDESDAAEDLAWERYQRGLVDIITVLESQRRAFTARQSLLSARNLRLRNRVSLHLALGGGFDARP
jgi:outer membrane protein, multidrug efflux system